MLNPLILALSASAATPTTIQSSPPPLACRANALDKAQRQQALLDIVRRTVLGKHDLPDGLALSFPADPTLFLQLAEWIGLERRCCPFTEFGLEWKSEG